MKNEKSDIYIKKDVDRNVEYHFLYEHMYVIDIFYVVWFDKQIMLLVFIYNLEARYKYAVCNILHFE